MTSKVKKVEEISAENNWLCTSESFVSRPIVLIRVLCTPHAPNWWFCRERSRLRAPEILQKFFELLRMIFRLLAWRLGKSDVLHVPY